MVALVVLAAAGLAVAAHAEAAMRQPAWRRIGYVVVVVAAVAFAVVPLLWMVSTSLKSNREITQDGTLVPHSFTFANYASLFNGREFGSYLTNSIVVTAVSVAIALLLGTHAAYALARFRLWRGIERYVGLAPAGDPDRAAHRDHHARLPARPGLRLSSTRSSG